VLDFSAISTTGRWVEQRWHSYEWVDLMLETTDMSAGLSFEFEGRGLAIVFDYGYQSAEFYYRLDEREWTYSNRNCPDWVGADGWYRLFDCGDELEQGKHRFELVLTEPKERRHKNEISDQLYLRIGRVGIIR